MNSTSLDEKVPPPEYVANPQPSPAVARQQLGHDTSTEAVAEADAGINLLALPVRPASAANVSSTGRPRPPPSPYSAASVPARAAAVGDEAANWTLKNIGAADMRWMWKVAVRMLMMVAEIIAFACMGVAVGNETWSTLRHNYDGSDDGWSNIDNELVGFALIPIGVSFLWCATVAIVLIKRRPPRPIHPSVPLAIDLILCLVFIAPLLILRYCVINVEEIGAGNAFPEDAEFDTFWHARQVRLRLLLPALVLTCVVLLLHFIMFVWACFDRAETKPPPSDGAIASNAPGNMRSHRHVTATANQGGNPGVSKGREVVSASGLV